MQDSIITPAILPLLIGVVDLQSGRAVHAVAGQRDKYEPVISGGQLMKGPHELLDRYSDLGLEQIYVADLDGITKQTPDRESLISIANSALPWKAIFVDIGWRPEDAFIDLAKNLVEVRQQVSIIVATETAGSPSTLRSLTSDVPPERLVISLDFHQGEFVGDQSVDDWLGASIDLGIHRFIALDIASVGTASIKSTASLCQRILRLAPSCEMITGGGIATGNDIHALTAIGCRRFLVATALHRIPTKTSDQTS